MKTARILRNNKGVALIFAVMIMLVALSVSIALTLLATTTYTTAMRQASQQQAFFYAKSIGQALSLQMGSDREEGGFATNEIIQRLDELSDPEELTSGELRGEFAIANQETNNEVVKGELRYYYPLATDPDTNKLYLANKYLYVDISVSYNGASSVVTAIFTCIEESEFEDNMYNLFANYQIYSTHPQDQSFNFASTSLTKTEPSVYLYVGENFTDPQTYTLSNNVKAQVTSTGDVSLTSSGSESYTISGNVTSYGNMVVNKAKLLTNLLSAGDLEISANGYVDRNIYSRGSTTVRGTGTSTDSSCTTDNIFSIGDVKLYNCLKKVSNIVGSSNCDVTLTSSTVSSIYCKGDVTLNGSVVNGDVYCGGKLTVVGSKINGNVTVGGDALICNSTTYTVSSVGNSSSSDIYIKGNLTAYNLTGTGNCKINGDVFVGGYLDASYFKTTVTYSTVNISGDLIVGGSELSGVTKVVRIVNYKIDGDVSLEKSVTPVFTHYRRQTVAINNLTDIRGALYMAGNMTFNGTTNENINMYGATINNFYNYYGEPSTASYTIKLSNGTINGNLIGSKVVLDGVTLGYDSIINSYFCDDYSTLGVDIQGKVKAITIDGSIIAKGSVRLGSGVTYNAHPDRYIYCYGNMSLTDNCSISGEIIVGDGVTPDTGRLVIGGNVSIKANSDNLNINVHGDLETEKTPVSASVVRDKEATIIVTGKVVNASRLGIVVLSGAYYETKYTEVSVSSAYLPPEANCKWDIKYILVTSATVTGTAGNYKYNIDISTNPDCIVYIGVSGVKITGKIQCGTLVIPQNLTNVNMTSLYAGKVITPAAANTSTQSSVLEPWLDGLAVSSSVVWNASVTVSGDSSTTYGAHIGDDYTYTSFTVNNSSTVNGLFRIDAATNVYFNGTLNAGAVKDLSGASAVITTLSGDLICPNSTVNIGKNAGGSTVTGAVINGNVYGKALDIHCGTVIGNVEALTVKSSAISATSAYLCKATSGDKFINCTTFELGYCTVGGSGANVTLIGVGTSTAPCIITNAIISAKVTATYLTVRGGKLEKAVYVSKNLVQTGGAINDNVTCLETITSNKGQLGKSASNTSDSGQVVCKRLTMSDAGYLGDYINLKITGTSENKICGGKMNNLYVSGSSSSVTYVYPSTTSGYTTPRFYGSVYVEAPLVFRGCRPSADKGLYAKNTTQNLYRGIHSCSDTCTTCLCYDISGNVYMPNMKATARFGAVTGNFDFNVDYGFTGEVRVGKVGGTIDSYNTTIYYTSSNTFSQSIDISGYLRIISGSSSTLTFSKSIVCDTLITNCTTSSYNSTSAPTAKYSSSTSQKLITFTSNVSVKNYNSTYKGYCFLYNTFFKLCTLYAEGAMYAKYCIFTGKNFTMSGTSVNLGDGSFYVNINNNSSSTYLYNSIVRSHMSVGANSRTYFSSTTCSTGLTFNGTKNWAGYYSYSMSYSVPEVSYSMGSTSINDGSDVWGMDDKPRDIINACVKYYYFPSGTDGLSAGDVFNGNIWDKYRDAVDPDPNGKLYKSSGSPITNNISSSASTNSVSSSRNDLTAGTADTVKHVAHGYSLMEDMTNPTVIADISEKWLPTVTFSNSVSAIKESKTNFGSFSVTPIVSGGPTTADNYILSINYWNARAIPLDWSLPTTTASGDAVQLNTRTNNIMKYATKEIKFEVTPSSLIDLVWEFIKNGPSGIHISNSMRSYIDVKTNEYFMPTSGNITNILSAKGDYDMIYYYRSIMDLKKIVDAANEVELSWKFWETISDIADLIKTIVNPYIDRSVGLTFFESGIVPKEIFNAKTSGSSTYTNGQVNWGNAGAVSPFISGSLADCNWTFFTCTDPTNPYGSAAKDLHIILPSDITMYWGKDVYNSFNIIGNGRVFLYLQSNTTITLSGNGAMNWLNGDTTNTLGGVRYVNVTTDANGNRFSSLASGKTGHFSPRLFIVGVGNNINLTIKDFQTMAYVYMPNGYAYGGKNNTFKIEASSGFISDAAEWISKNILGNASASDQWDVYGMYVTDDFEYGNDANVRVNYVQTVPDLSATTIYYGIKNNVQTLGKYNLSEFWGIPSNLPRSGLEWNYKGIVSY